MAAGQPFDRDVGYTQAERTIIDFISTNPAEFLVMPIQQLAARLGISDATVSRFARHAGYRDFKDLKAAVAAGARASSARADDAGGSPSPASISIERQRSYLAKTADLLDADAFDRAVCAISEAPLVLVHAQGAAIACSDLLRFRLARFSKTVMAVPAGGSELFEGLVHVSERSVVLTFSFRRLSEESRVVIEHAGKVGAMSILVCDQAVSGMPTKADAVLALYRGTPNEYHSMTSAIALTDALIEAVAVHLNGSAAAELDRLRALRKAYSSVLPQ